MPTTMNTVSEVLEQKAAHIIHELWSGEHRYYWIKTLRTLRIHWIAGRWDPSEARKLIARNVREASKALSYSGEELPLPARERATSTLLDTVERMLNAETEDS